MFSRKYLSAVVALVVPVCSFAQLEYIWAEGVSKESGWFDTNKYWDGTDWNLCWVASASNIVGWWNARSQVTGLTGIPRTNTEVYSDFVNNIYGGATGSPDYAYAWYFGGAKLNDNAYQNIFKSPADAKNFQGYWSDFVNEQGLSGTGGMGLPKYCAFSNAISTYENQTAYVSFSSEIRSYFENGAGITLSLSPEVAGTGHEVTLWGVEFDGDKVAGVFITDSDDNTTELKYLEIVYETVVQEYGDGKDTPIVSWEETRMALKDYGTGAGKGYWYIRGATALTLPYYSVPEPSAFGLTAGLGTLAFALSRRRRSRR